ncbi:MAG: zinc ribbon domain-containing protein [Candidatus Izimaplasma sp.]|nr:zinc ribbon domain-containing protein [Candidatus Izimaplasma bacterium]
MPYCSNCGNPVTEEQDVCLACGKKLTNSEKKSVSNVSDTGGFGWGLLGFCIPIVGLILFIVWKEDQPNNAKATGKGALISVIFSVTMYLIMFMLGLGGPLR